MKQINKVVLQTTIHQMLRNIFSYAGDIYLCEEPETDAVEIIKYVSVLQSPQLLKKALKSGEVCPAIYFDLEKLDNLTRDKIEYTVEILDDDGKVWVTLAEDEVGEW